MPAPRSTILEDLTNQVDGVTSAFVIAGGPFIAGTLTVDHNGLRLRPGSGLDFEEVGVSAFLLDFVPRLGDTVQIQYEIEDLGAGFPLVVASGIDPS